MRDAVVAVLVDGGRFLVVRRGPEALAAGFWSPLSGRIEPGESQEEAVVREVHEEVGLDARPVAKVWQCASDDGGFRLHWWTAETDDTALELDRAEVSDARWVTPEEFLEMQPTFAGDREFVLQVLPTVT